MAVNALLMILIATPHFFSCFPYSMVYACGRIRRLPPVILISPTSLSLSGARSRSSDTEDYMPLNASITVQTGPEPPKPPPPPPAPPMLFPLNGGTINNSANKTNASANKDGSQTGTNKSTNGNIPPPPPPQDSTIRKQQQPLSAISIQDLNSVQVRTE